MEEISSENNYHFNKKNEWYEFKYNTVKPFVFNGPCLKCMKTYKTQWSPSLRKRIKTKISNELRKSKER